ncbi:hypothetical protein KAU18_07415 [Candidatus Bathyarchaeota archaeon]|nr:hypothetical protein [Candidatus Bathyarchaeota archaeon]
MYCKHIYTTHLFNHAMKMFKSYDESDIERRLFRDSTQDGLMELLLGVSMVGLAAASASLLFTPLYIAPLAFGRHISEAVRRRYTYPRIGYVRLREEPTGRSVAGVLLYEFLVLTGTAAAFLLLFGDVANFSLWARWSPLIISALLLGLFLHLRGRSGSLRYLALASISVAAGFVLSVVSIDFTFPHLFGELGPGAVLYFLFVGAVMIVSGVARFAYFVSRSPVAPEDGA